MSNLPVSLPPTLSGTPLLGNALQFFRDPISLLKRGLKEFGNIFSFRLGSQPAVALLGPDYSRFFFDQTDKLLSIRSAYPFFISMFSERTYFFAKPDEYREQRNIILPCFQGKKMANYVDVMARVTAEFMAQLGPSGQCDLTSTLGPLVMKVASAAFLGEDFCRRLGKEFFDVFRAFSGGMELILPLWLPLPRLLRSKRAKVQIQEMLKALIASRRRVPRVPEDFLQTLVSARYSDGEPVPDSVIINLIIILVWAGHETTAGHISWALADLLRHPDYLETVLDQQGAVLGDGTEIDYEHLQRLKRMEWALKETERLNPVAYVLMRAAQEDLELSGYLIPKGSSVFLSPTLSHRLPEVWQSPDVYDPERFGPERAEDKRPYSLIGFGGGTHRCAGVNFAYQEMKVILTLLLQRYELKLLDESPQPVSGARTKWPQSPCRVRYRLRERRRAPSLWIPPEPTARCPFHASVH